jgi:cell wall-associated NlpC family hydrolase
MTDQPFDRRTTPCRDDLAATRLRGVLSAPRYAEAERFRVAVPSVPLRRAPDPALAYDSELLFGEAFDVYEARDGWAWGQAEGDGYVGYLPVSALVADSFRPTHRVSALRSFVYPVAGIKTTPSACLPYGALVTTEGDEGRFARIPSGYVFAEHLAPLGAAAADPVAEAERFLGIPYLWGGRSSLGLDCSGLVQIACMAAGIAAPRDSDMQEAALGEALAVPGDPADFRRGDLLFWRGHVAMAQGEGRMVHATAFSMSVISEPIGPAIARIAAQGDPLRSVRRLASK